MTTRAIEVRNPPSFVIVSGPDGKLWLNAHRILRGCEVIAPARTGWGL
jgi:hypothetical protein